MFKALDELMDKFKHDITLEDYSLWVQVNLGNDYNNFLSLLKEENVNEDVLEDTLHAIKTRSVLYELAGAALAGSEGTGHHNGRAQLPVL
jgi:hypothetical protein